MIPKKIHYCWFGRNPKPELFYKCLNSWKKHCKEYEIIEWNEDNFDISSCPLYVQQAYNENKWAFVTDYVRLKVVHDHGGIYLDTDVELKKSLDKLLTNNAYFGFEDGIHINTGLGFGAVAGLTLLYEIMEDYQTIPFVLPDGSYDIKPCPVRNTEIFLRHGLVQNDQLQKLKGEILILPTIYLCPISYSTGKYKKSLRTISIHWFSASWHTEEQKKSHEEYLKKRKQMMRTEKIDYLIHIPNRIMLSLLGRDNYEKIKDKIKNKIH